jgi:Acetyl-CoA dehydrogenase C-terminal like
MAATLTGYLMAAAERPTEIYKVGLGSVRFLLAVGDLLIGWRLLVQADVAQKALRSNGSDADFYRGKIAVAGFFAANMLPGLTAVRSVLDNMDADVMELPEGAF